MQLNKISPKWRGFCSGFVVLTEILRVVKMPTLSPLAAQEIVMTTTSNVTSHGKVGVMTTLGLPSVTWWVSARLRHSGYHNNTRKYVYTFVYFGFYTFCYTSYNVMGRVTWRSLFGLLHWHPIILVKSLTTTHFPIGVPQEKFTYVYTAFKWFAVVWTNW